MRTSGSWASPAPSRPTCNWAACCASTATIWKRHYRHILTELGKGSGLIPVIFRKAQNKIQDPAKLRRLIELIDGETWIGLDIDVKGEIYEGLLEKNAQDTKAGAGQYFTPRPLIKAHRGRDAPAARARPSATRPAARAASCWPRMTTSPSTTSRSTATSGSTCSHEALHGWEIVDNTARLCVMNLYLHGIGANGGRAARSAWPTAWPPIRASTSTWC